MKNLNYLLVLFVLVISCGQNDLEKETLHLKEKELALKERELTLQEKSTSDQPSDDVESSIEVTYTSHSPCMFGVKLPSNYKLEPIQEDISSDYCDYHVKGKPEGLILKFHSLLNSRFNFDNIEELYDAALKSTKLDVGYKAQKGNWFVISGTNKSNGNAVYWKRVWGEMYVSDLHIEYPKSKASEIEPSIGTISNSFTSR